MLKSSCLRHDITDDRRAWIGGDWTGLSGLKNDGLRRLNGLVAYPDADSAAGGARLMDGLVGRCVDRDGNGSCFAPLASGSCCFAAAVPVASGRCRCLCQPRAQGQADRLQ